MFTGLIIELGEVEALQKRGHGAILSIKADKIMSDIEIGDSVSVNGVCLTVVSCDSHCVFDVSEETLKSSNLGALRRGDKVNLEPSLKLGSKFGGHIVTGHVSAIGKITSRKRIGNAERVEIQAPADTLKYAAPKGSIAVDGVSLTVADATRESFSVVIIPHTASMTTIGFKKPGSTVNLEPDILAKYLEWLLKSSSAGAFNDTDNRLLSKLRDSGFI